MGELRIHPPLVVLLTAGSLVVGCGPLDQRVPGRGGGAARTGPAGRVAPRPEAPDAVRLIGARRARLTAGDQVALRIAAWRFAETLTRWLYGRRDRVHLEAAAPALRRGLGRTPPYVPPDLRGTGEGSVAHVDVAAQTRDSGVLVVRIRDPRTTYPVSARYERRRGRFEAVALNDD